MQHKKQGLAAVFLVVVVIILLPITVIAIDKPSNNGDSENEESLKQYTSPEERREEEFGIELYDWVGISGSLEWEREKIENKFSNNIKRTETEKPVFTFQLGFDLTFNEWLTAEVIFEVEDDGIRTHSTLDEGYINTEIEKWNFMLGKVDLPFGMFYSHFVTDPMLQFAETRRSTFVVDYTLLDNVQVTGFIFDSDVTKQNQDDKYDWGAGIGFTSDNNAIRLGASYISDVAESDEELLKEEGNVFNTRVPAWNAYALIGMSKFELTAEYVRATKAFSEFDKNENKPSSFNSELAFFPSEKTQIAIRLERSSELSEQPENQYGISGKWYPTGNISMSLEYLYGKYKRQFVVDDDDNELQTRDILTGNLLFEF